MTVARGFADQEKVKDDGALVKGGEKRGFNKEVKLFHFLITDKERKSRIGKIQLQANSLYSIFTNFFGKCIMMKHLVILYSGFEYNRISERISKERITEVFCRIL